MRSAQEDLAPNLRPTLFFRNVLNTAFYGTDLDLQLRRRGLTTIILCGIATEFGVESTARDAYERGYELVFAEDAMTGRNAESHANAIRHIFPRIGRVRRTEEIVAALGAGIGG